MNAQTTRLLESYRLAPPRDSRKLAEFRRALWQSYPVRRRNQLRDEHSQRPYYPELPELNVTRGRTLDILLSAEKKKWNVSPCWSALDRGMSHKRVRDAFHAARRRASLDATLDFSTYLHSLLAGRAEVSEPVAPATARAAQLKPTAAALPKLGQEWDDKLARAAEVLDVTPLQVMQAAITHFYTNHEIEQVSQRQQQVTASVQQVRAAVQGLLPSPAKPPVRAKPAPKPTLKKKPEQVAVASPPPSAALDEKMPALHRRLQIVMGDDECSIPECIERLTARGWLPDSKEIKAYISLALSTHVKDLFERMRRGVYRVRPVQSAGPKASSSAKANGPAKPNGASRTNPMHEDISVNPFLPAAN